MKTIYAQEPLDWTGAAIFLAGPTLRNKIAMCDGAIHDVFPDAVFIACPSCNGDGFVNLPQWRKSALEHLSDAPEVNVTVIVPEFRDGRSWTAEDASSWTAQVEWEDRAMSDPRTVLMFWVPRDMKTLPGLTTNIEFGYYLAKRPHALVVGYPEDAQHVRYFKEKARLHVKDGDIEFLGFSSTLLETCARALARAESFAAKLAV